MFRFGQIKLWKLSCRWLTEFKIKKDLDQRYKFSSQGIAMVLSLKIG